METIDIFVFVDSGFSDINLYDVAIALYNSGELEAAVRTLTEIKIE